MADGLPYGSTWRDADGRTTMFAAQHDQRFSYCLFLPPLPDSGAYRALIVAVHGTERGPIAYRDRFVPLAQRYSCAILAPLFPAGIGDPRDVDNYKFIEHAGVRYDEVLLAMIDEAVNRFGVPSGRFLLFGFSGGGQFVQRFLYLHPDRLAGVSIGAPGRVTLLDDATPWWLGTQDVAERLGRPVDLDGLRQVPIQILVGGNDVNADDVNDASTPTWLPGAADAGRTRVDRARTVLDNYRAHGLPARLDVVDGVAHEGHRVVGTASRFFAEVLGGVG